MGAPREKPGSVVAATDPIASSPVYPAGSRVNAAGRLEIAGCDVVDLANEHGTPVYIYAEEDMRARAAEYLSAFSERTGDFEVIFASKAFPCTAAYALFEREGLSVDVASGGELHMALSAGFDPARIHLHGNNKSEAELRYAFDSGVGHLVLDSFDEIGRADSLLTRPQRVLIRITPGIQASTHSYISTGQEDSKFGFGLADGLAEQAVGRVRESRNLELIGLHAHIGSQIFELEPYTTAIEVLTDFTRAVDLEPEILNVGGGLGIAYLDGDEPPLVDDYVDVKVRGVERVFDPVPRIAIEPGRSLVGNAGVTAYRVGTVKDIPGVRTYVAVDGGMSDNLRPMLYGARYEAEIADRFGDSTACRLVGMHCESGDVLVRRTRLPDPRPGDVLVTAATGAYGHAMASNYNGIRRPPVLFCSGGEARVVVRRETYEDLSARDI
jgi:diaminopimelate decarboxylase